MASGDQGNGFGLGVVLGGLAGLAAGVWLASGPARPQVERLRDRTIELTSRSAEQAREVMSNPDHPLNRALQEGLSAARQRRGELQLEQRQVELSDTTAEIDGRRV
jgi:hypothetical protein